MLVHQKYFLRNYLAKKCDEEEEEKRRKRT